MKNIVVGIDPGTTLGCAVFDTEGNLLDVFSSKQHDFSSTVLNVIKFGKPILVGCDKATIPGFVEKFASAFNAKIVSPKNDMLMIEKKNLTKSFKFRNTHEMDALASAMFVFRQYSELFKKVSSYTDKYGKENIKDKILGLIILNDGLNIKNAVDIIEDNDKKDKVEVNKNFEQVLSVDNFIRLHEKINMLNKDITYLKSQNNHLRDILGKENKTKIVKVIDKDAKEKIKFKDKKIYFLSTQLNTKTSEIITLKKEIELLNMFLSELGKYELLKILPDLSYNAFIARNEILNIKGGDIIFVENPAIVSDKTVNILTEKNCVVIYDGTNALKNKLVSMPAKDLGIIKTTYFGIVNKKDFLVVKEKTFMLSNIISNYKSERINSF